MPKPSPASAYQKTIDDSLANLTDYDDVEVRRWIQAVPNVVFSLGPRSLSLAGDEAAGHERAVRGLPLDRIVLETDAPYLQHPGRVLAWAGGTPSPRSDLYAVGQWVGRLKGLCPYLIFEVARLNAARVFSLPEN